MTAGIMQRGARRFHRNLSVEWRMCRKSAVEFRYVSDSLTLPDTGGEAERTRGCFPVRVRRNYASGDFRVLIVTSRADERWGRIRRDHSVPSVWASL